MQYSRISLVLLFAICIGAFLVRVEGIKWPKLHPDEIVIGTWLEQTTRSVYIHDRVYPNGFFALARPFVFACKVLRGLSDKFDYVCGHIDRVRGVRTDGIYFGRWFNALAGTLLCVLVFLLVSVISRSRSAGLVAAGLVGFSRYAVEHSHYAETDIAALLMLVLALWLWAIAHDSSRLRLFLAAAFVSGFAAGTKFTLIALVPLVLVEAIVFGLRKHLIKAVCLGIIVFAAGFVLANPAVLLDWHWFWSEMAAEKQRVFAETILNLGSLGAQPGVKALHHLKLFCGHALTLGWPWLILIMAGLPCAILNAEARRHWTILLFLPVIYAGYWLYMAPWVRSQEFLLFLPSFAALAMLPLAALWRSKSSIGRALVVIVALVALAVSGAGGLRVADLFGWKDTRVQAMEWLQVNLPSDGRVAAESYAEAACPVTLQPPLAIKKIERDGIAPLLVNGADYFLRAASVSGRGLHHPLTGELYPGPLENLRQFTDVSTLLRSWAPLPPQGLATFASPVIELYGLKHFTPDLFLRASLPQPALIVNADQNPVGRETFCPVGYQLGCAKALLIDRLPQTIAVGGPDDLGSPVFLVLNTAERPAVINVRGFGARKKVALAPYDTCAIPLARPAWSLAAEPYEKITLSAEPVEDVLYIPCYARVVFSVEEVVRLFLDTAREDKIADYFSEELLECELGPELKYILAVRTGARPASAQVGELARRQIDKCLKADPGSISINGINGFYYGQFAGARLQKPYELACGPQGDQFTRTPFQTAIKVLDLHLPEGRSNGQAPGASALPGDPYSQIFPLPILAARGKYELRGEIMLQLTNLKGTSAVPLTVEVQGDHNARVAVALEPGKWRAFSMLLRPSRETQPCLELRAPVAVQVRLKNMEIAWTMASALESLRDELASNDQLPPGAESALRNRKALAEFTPWLALVGFNFDPTTREVNCVFEALRDDTPKLAVTFWIKRRGEWRRKYVQPIGAKQWMHRREREVVVCRLDSAFGATLDVDKLGLGISTDVAWHPGAITSAGGGYVVPFSSIMNASKPDLTGN
jgi:hypothetical protein